MSYFYDPCNPCVPVCPLPPPPCPCPPICLNQPIFTSVAPASILSGVTSTVVVTGFNLGNVTGVTFSSPGLTLTGATSYGLTLNADGTLSVSLAITPSTTPSSVTVILLDPPCAPISFPLAVTLLT